VAARGASSHNEPMTTSGSSDRHDELTRSTRLAANAGAVAVVAYAALFFVTTQTKSVRSASPFGDDPWDVVVSYGVIFLAIVVAATGVRSLRHRGPTLGPAIAARIRTGVVMALVTIGVTLVSDLSALVVAPLPDPAAAHDGRLALIVGLLVVNGVTTAAATVLLVRAASIARRMVAPIEDATEPDILDDLLGLARDGAALIPPMRGIADRMTSVVERFLASSPASPRRHRLAFGVLAAVATSLAYAQWHAIVEGAWASLLVAALFAVLTGGGVLAVYIATLGPLRLIRPYRP
jgi:hypothetical protein